MAFDSKRSLLLVLSAENKLEIFKVVGSHKKETILKKLVKREKKASVKRTHSEMELHDDMPARKSVDKAKLAQMVEDGSYDITLHFSRKLAIPLAETTGSKAKSFVVLRSDEKSMRVVVTFHSNTALEYEVDLKAGKVDPFVQKTEFGQLTSHRTPIRGVTISANDQLFTTNSFDSVKVWTCDLFQYSQKNNIEI